MDTFTLYVVTLIWSAIFLKWYFSGRFQLASLASILFFTGTYYALCIPLDLIFDNNIPYFEGTLDLSAGWFLGHNVQVLLYYVSFFVGFSSLYFLVPHLLYKKEQLAQQPPARFSLQSPSIGIILAVNILLLIVYANYFWLLPRGGRILLLREDVLARGIEMSKLFLNAFNILCLWLSRSQKKGALIVVFGVFASVLFGARTWLVLYVFLYLVRFDIIFNRRMLVGAAVAGVLFIIGWKFLAENVRRYSAGGEDLIPVSEVLEYSTFSSVEGIGTYLIFSFFLSDGASPLYLGRTYTTLAAKIALPRFLLEQPAKTLGESFMYYNVQEGYEKGYGLAFSALAEAWLNFGMLGPLLIGALMGLLCQRVDRRSQSLWFPLWFLMALRFFRTDFASLFKTIVILFGANYLAAVLVLLALQSLSPTAKSLRRTSG